MPTTLYGRTHLACIPLRAQPSHRSELVNQLLYGETYQILKQHEEWYYLQCRHDQYEGWMAAHQYHACSADQWAADWKGVVTVASQWDATRRQQLYLGSPRSEPLPSEWLQKTPIERAYAAAESLLYAPYLWGGRTQAGIDCSGLMQVAYRAGGWLLPRDASQQVQEGQAVAWGEQQRGDLAFFENAKGTITHVGMVLDEDLILHASGWVRMDYLSEKGIWHRTEQTHHLADIRRLGSPTLFQIS